jgi:hypothetical protein
MTEFNNPTRWPSGDSLAELRAKLQRLEQAGDSNSPTIADLKRIVAQRISEAEAAGQSQMKLINTPNLR